MEIDHIFMFIKPDGPQLDQLKSLGLVETYRRQHPGQGTANVCYAFDNMFIELLWLVDRDEALSSAILRTGLEARSRWKTAGTCPFGIAWRGGDDDAIATWDFAPPYLPKGVTIDVAIDGDDPRQPMMFTFPGSSAPSSWDEARKGGLQHAAGFRIVSHVTLTLPFDVAPSAALTLISSRSSPSLFVQKGAKFRLDLVFKGEKNSLNCQLGG
jgi:Glyoxalase-like domain